MGINLLQNGRFTDDDDDSASPGAGRGMFGRGQIIQRKVDARSGRTVWAAGSDPRADGHAVAQI